MKKRFLSLVFAFMFVLLGVYYVTISFACMNKQAKDMKCVNASQTVCPGGVSKTVCESKNDMTEPRDLPLDYEDATGEKLVEVVVQNEADGLMCYTYAPCQYYPNGMCVHTVVRTSVNATSWWTTEACD